MTISAIFTRIASTIARAAGHPAAFSLAVVSIVAWAIAGPAASFSETWQLIVNTSTTIVTFLMVFVLQNTQNRDTTALHAKLDELLRSTKGDLRFVGIEHLSEDELETIRRICEAKALKIEGGGKPTS